ncbi:MAG: type II toxin-antitoxin system mRNA interferase toxin, RelE/StbE family [Caldilineaceae bacterium]|nr:type II toxin-antitoxin system mRNA interferase toxin, RelE/StbE family [Caldilineaceae bacterium]
MRRLVYTPQFLRSYRKYIRRNRLLQARIEDTFRLMESDVFAPSLGTHKLSGELMGLRTCSCGYDCRIVFRIEVDESTELEVILLINIGTHDEVY